MTTAVATLHPIADVQNIWSQFPSDGLPAYQKIDEEHADHDDDTSYIFSTTTNATSRFRMTDPPNSLSTSTRVTVRFWAKGDNEFDNLSIAIYVDGISVESASAAFDTAPGTWLETVLPLSLTTIKKHQTVEIAVSAGVFPGSTVYLTSVEIVLDYIAPSWISQESATGGWNTQAGGDGTWIQMESGSGSWTKS
jgi:hypothetical protein